MYIDTDKLYGTKLYIMYVHKFCSFLLFKPLTIHKHKPRRKKKCYNIKDLPANHNTHDDYDDRILIKRYDQTGKRARSRFMGTFDVYL